MRSQREHAHHWSWPRRRAVEFAPGHVGTHQRCYCGASRVRGVKADPDWVPAKCGRPLDVLAWIEERLERDAPASTELVVRAESRRRLIVRPRMAGAAGPFYWVGGTGTWDNATSTHWALSTGGAGGAGVPTAADNVLFDNSSGLTSGTTVTIAATAACNNLTISGIAQASAAFALSGNATISGAASVQGNSVTQRLLFSSSTAGTQRTLTFTTVSALANVDFMDVKGAGGLATFAGTSIGDAQGNATITFTATRTLYWVATAGGNWSATTSWSLTTGGASGQNPPLPQDDVQFDNLSITSAGHTISCNLLRSGRNITVSLVWATTWTYTVNWNGYGSLDFSASYAAGASLITFTSTSTQTLRGRGASSFNMPQLGSPVFTQGWQIIAPGGTYTINSDWATNISAATAIGFSLVSGSVNFGIGGASFTSTSINIASAAAVSIDFFNFTDIHITGTQNTSGGYVWNAGALATISNVPRIWLQDASANNKTFNGGGRTYNVFYVSTAAANGYIFTGGNHYGDFTLTTGLVMLSTGNTHTFNTFVANSGTGGLYVRSNTGGVQTTIAAEAGIGGFSWKGVTVQDITTSAALTIFVNAGTNTSNNGARVVFTSPARTYAPTQSQSPKLARTLTRTFTPTAWGYDKLLMAEPLMTSYWRLEDAASPFTDDMGLASMTGFAGIAPQDAGPLTDPALTDYGVAFDGATGYCSTPYLPDLNPANFTMEAWVKATTVAPLASVEIMAARPSNTGYALLMTSAGLLTLVIYDGAAGTSITVPGAKALTAGVWYHVAVTFDGAAVNIYINGALAKTQAFSTYVPNTTGATFIARNTAASQYWPGSISRVAMFPLALDASRIAAHYQAGVGAGGQGQIPAVIGKASRLLKPAGQSQTPKHLRTPNRTLKPAGQSGGVTTQGSDTRTFKPTQSQTPTLAAADTRTFKPAGQSQGATLSAADARMFKPSGQSQATTLAASDARTLKPAGQSQTATLKSVDARTFTSTQTEAVSFHGVVPPRTLTLTQSQTPTVRRTVVRAVAPSQSQAVVLGRSLQRTLAAAQSAAGVLVRAIPATRALSQSMTATTLRQSSRAVKASQSQSCALGRTTLRTLSATQSQAVVLKRAASRGLAVGQAAAGALLRTAVRTSVLGQAAAVVVLRTVARTSALGQAQAPIVGRALGRAMAVGGSQATFIRGSAGRVQKLTQAQAPVLARIPGRALAAAGSQSAVIARALQRGRTAAQAAVTVLRRDIAAVRPLTQAQTPVARGTLARARTLTQTQTYVLARTAARVFPAAQGAGVLLRRALANVLVGTQPASSTLTRGCSRVLSIAADQAAVMQSFKGPMFLFAQSQALSVARRPERSLEVGQTQQAARRSSLAATFVLEQAAGLTVIALRAATVSATQGQSAALTAIVGAARPCSQSQRLRVVRGGRRAFAAAQSQAGSVRWRAAATLPVTQDQLPGVSPRVSRTIQAGGSQLAAAAGVPARSFTAAQSMSRRLTRQLAVTLTLSQRSAGWLVGRVPLVALTDFPVTLALTADSPVTLSILTSRRVTEAGANVSLVTSESSGDYATAARLSDSATTGEQLGDEPGTSEQLTTTVVD